MQNGFRLVLAPALHQEISLPVAPFVFLFRLHRQARKPGVQPAAIARTERHTHPALNQRGRFRTHNGVVAPAGLLGGHVTAHEAPRHDIAQLLRLRVVQLLRLNKRRDHQPGVFRIFAGDACERHCRHLTGEVGRADAAHKRHHAIGIVCETHQRAADGLVIRRQLTGQRTHQPRVALFHRETNTLKVSQRILRAGSTPRRKKTIARCGQVFAGLPEIFRALPRALRVAGVKFRVVVIALRLGATRRLRAEGEKAAPVFAARQFIHKARGERTRRRQRRVRLNKLLHRECWLIHQVIGELAVLQIGIERIGLQRGH
ncbi:hypothetical protein BN134_1529 [Cronobacter dublinensis 1210]|uniref:Uncharacterized protein n=1 Tax=Cronobacter dublinensis 1210 TaxID=1208656 RepID=A0ABP1W635_9ENTR|nr:hypothetical protein BN134_1529 [Cronobacter dublinensis 1210]